MRLKIMKQMKRKINNSFCVGLILLALSVVSSQAFASLTLQGPSGFIRVPSHETIKAKQVEVAVNYQLYRTPLTNKDASLMHYSFGFSPLRDFELGFTKAVDSRKLADEPDPLLNFKVRLPSLGTGEFSELTFGGVFDTNPNNYHTLYLTFGGFGVGWNFGGNRFNGMANYGSYDRGKNEPKSMCLLIGAEYPKRRPGQRGYMGQAFVDYNGDVFSAGWRYRSHRGFYFNFAVNSKSSYTDFYDFRPVVVGLGAIF